MTIKRQSGPVDGLKIASEAFALRARRFSEPPTGGAFAEGSAPGMSAPLPVFSLTVEQAKRKNPLQSARPSEWRYAVYGLGVNRMVHLRAEGEGKPSYAGISEGALVNRVIEAGQLVDSQFGETAEELEPRLLDIPELHVCALWLCSARHNYFVPLTSAEGNRIADLKIVNDIRPTISAAISDLREESMLPPDNETTRADQQYARFGARRIGSNSPTIPSPKLER